MAPAGLKVPALPAPPGPAPVGCDGRLAGLRASAVGGAHSRAAAGAGPCAVGGRCRTLEDEADVGSCSTAAEGHLQRACGESVDSSRGEEPREPSELGDAASGEWLGGERRALGTTDEDEESGQLKVAASVPPIPGPVAAPCPPQPGCESFAAAGAGGAGVFQAGAPLQHHPQESAWPGLQAVPISALPSSGELILRDILGSMDFQMQLLREPQRRLVDAVDRACQKALGRGFARLILVGSAALSAETPDSDVDVVCVTRRDGTEAPGAFCGVHKKVHEALLAWAMDEPVGPPPVSVEMIDEARVPILRLISPGPPGSPGPVVVDVSFDQQGPIDHVEWFRAAGVAPQLGVPHPAWAPLVTSMLRCIKWWLRVRQIPRSKEGGLPTMAWLLMAAHVFLSESVGSRAHAHLAKRPTAALMEILRGFFAHFSAPGGLNGVLSFSADEAGKLSSTLAHRQRQRSPWGEFAVRDPTREGNETSLAPRMLPATQLLLTVELGRAAERLTAEVADNRDVSWESAVSSAESIMGLFAPRPEGANSLPTNLTEPGASVGAILLLGDPSRDIGRLEVGLIDSSVPRAGWRAPFLHRADERSEIYVRLCDVDADTGACAVRKGHSPLVLCPCHFVCSVGAVPSSTDLGRGKRWSMDAGGLELYRRMHRLLQEMERRHEGESRQQPPPQASCCDEQRDEPPTDFADPLRRPHEPRAAAAQQDRQARYGGRGKKHAAPASTKN